MKPLSLQLRNVRTYESLDLDLPEGAVAIVGQNGSGKSSMVNAIDIALFGPEGRTLADWLSESDPQGTMTITLVFEHEREMYRARRTYIGKGRGSSKFELELSPPRADGDYYTTGHWEPLTIESQAATTESLEAMLGLTRETFRASSFISQGVMFCDLAPREQKRILGELLNLGQWDTWLARARTAKRQSESELDRIAGALERAEQELEAKTSIENELTLAQEKAESAKANLVQATAALTVAREALAEEQARVERRRNAEIALQQAERGLSELKAAIVQREDEVLGLDERLAARKDLAEAAAMLGSWENARETLRIAVEMWDARQRLLAEVARATEESDVAYRQIASLLKRAEEVVAAVGEEHCDRCGQVLGRDAAERAAQSYRDEAGEVGVRYSERQDALVALNTQIDLLPADEPDRAKIATLEVQIADARTAKMHVAALDEVQARHDRALQELDEMRAGLPDRERVAAAARADAAELGPHDPDALRAADDALYGATFDADHVRSVLSVAEQDIARYEERLARLDKIAAEAEEGNLRRDALHADLDLYAQMERACGPNGVPALILENVAIPQIEAAANEILARFGSKALGLEMLTQREKKDGGLADTLQIRVLTEHGARDYKTFSTGERLRINAAVTLAIAQLVAARSAQTGLLVIDDLGPLDSQGMSVLVEICNELAEKIRSVFVISQSPELRDAFEQSIVLESVDGRSRIVGQGVEVPA